MDKNLKQRKSVIYARTNRGGIEGHNAISHQIKTCKSYINSQDNLTLMDIYIERGLSAIGTKQIHGCEAMIMDAKLRKFDLVITVSINAFSRNTDYLLKITREMLEHNVDTYFIRERTSMSYIRSLNGRMLACLEQLYGKDE